MPRTPHLLMAVTVTAALIWLPLTRLPNSNAAPLLPSPTASTSPIASPAAAGSSQRVALRSVAGTVDVHQARVQLADGGFSGVIPQLPTDLEFSYRDPATITDPLRPGDQREASTAATAEIPFQRFDIPAPASGAVVWQGSADPTRLVRLWAWNTVQQRWIAVDAARGSSEGSISLRGELSAELIDRDQVHVLVTGEDPFADDQGQARTTLSDPSSYDFAIAHLSDTQYLSEGAVERNSAAERAIWRKAYAAIPNWIVDNAAERKIVYTVHTGDLIEDWLNTRYAAASAAKTNARRQFAVASSVQKILDDAEAFNAVLPGNHDTKLGTDSGSDSLYNDYFGPQRYQRLEKTAGWKAQQASYHPWRSGDNTNHYDLFTAGGLDFVAVHLGYGVTPAAMSWANRVLDRYRDRNAILFTHAFNKASFTPDGRGGEYSNDGARLEEQVVAPHPNVMLVVSGHEHGVSVAVKHDLGRAGNDVTELLADYQFYQVRADKVGLAGIGGHAASDPLRFGASFLQLLQFDVADSSLKIDTFSPFLNDHGASEYDNQHRYTGAEDATTVPVQLTSRTTSFRTDTVGVTLAEATPLSADADATVWLTGGADQVLAWQAERGQAVVGYGLVTMPAVSATAEAGGAAPALGPLNVEQGKAVDVAYSDAPSAAGPDARDSTAAAADQRLIVLGGADTSRVGTQQVGYVVVGSDGSQTFGQRRIEVSEAQTAEASERRHPQISVLLASTRVGLATTAYVTVKANNQLVEDGSVTLSLDGHELARINLSEGRTQYALPAVLAVGGHVLATSYSGDEATEPARIESTFTVAASAQR